MYRFAQGCTWVHPCYCQTCLAFIYFNRCFMYTNNKLTQPNTQTETDEIEYVPIDEKQEVKQRIAQMIPREIWEMIEPDIQLLA